MYGTIQIIRLSDSFGLKVYAYGANEAEMMADTAVEMVEDYGHDWQDNHVILYVGNGIID